MARVRVAVIGGGSAYMPGIIRGFIGRAADLAGSEMVLQDVDQARVELMGRLAGRMFAAAHDHAGTPAADRLQVRVAPDLEAALDDVDFVLTTFRPGGLAARHLDESIPLRHGVVGQETAGPGGFLMACRSVPVLLGIARTLAARAPRAWIVNYTNPTNVVTDAVLRFSDARIVGLCDQHIGDLELWADLLDLPREGLEADWFGLNHATWAERVRAAGKDLSAVVRARLTALDPTRASEPVGQLARLARLLGLLPNSYARYYLFHDEVVQELRAKGTTRAEDLTALMPGYYADYARAATLPQPDPSSERGGGVHGDFAVDAICAIAGDERRRMIVNVRNGGAIDGLPEEAVVEVPSRVGRDGARPLAMGPLPHPVRGLTQAVHEYEWLAAEAAARGDRDLALQALAVHPFVRSLPTAEAILQEGLAAHAEHLPQFRTRRVGHV
ncbi:MAG TPA: hypothetical protein VFK38_02705 [Candidatus Limnocylindrales bacterium]|nr:hypothetical protein [Candidatus Limnocylindrales bacterium]